MRPRSLTCIPCDVAQERTFAGVGARWGTEPAGTRGGSFHTDALMGDVFDCCAEEPERPLLGELAGFGEHDRHRRIPHCGFGRLRGARRRPPPVRQSRRRSPRRPAPASMRSSAARRASTQSARECRPSTWSSCPDARAVGTRRLGRAVFRYLRTRGQRNPQQVRQRGRLVGVPCDHELVHIRHRRR